MHPLMFRTLNMQDLAVYSLRLVAAHALFVLILAGF